MALGLLGRKIGMTQVNTETGKRIAVTVVEVGPCVVVQKKTLERDGYTALKLGFGDKREKNTTKPIKGIFEKLKTKPRKLLREFKVTAEELGKFEEGKDIKVEEVFKQNQLINVSGQTKGRGTMGVMVRWNMKGNDATHGTHEFWRHQGSIGTRTWPGWVHKGKRMGGHYGDERVTIQHLKVVQILPEKNCMLIEGAIPGANDGLLELRPCTA